VLVVDDEADIRELLELTLVRMGLAVDGVGTVKEAIESLKQRRYALCLTDMRLPDGEGLEVLRYVTGQNSDLPVAVITAHGSTENAVAALKLGAFDYLSKPIGLDQLRTLVKSALNLPSRGLPGPAVSPILGESPGIRGARATIAKLARSQAPVYISGESGCGKELAARLIHAGGARRAQSFVPVNCGAIPENLMESEFFGYKKGAFTGAEADRDGFFQVANGGTLFLDEVADLPLAMQVKLLRAIQEKKVRKVGATSEEAADVRFVCATHQSLAGCVESGRFRQDLYYRLNVIELRMPALRECREDIPLLADSILLRLGQQAGVVPPKLSRAALEALCQYDFPGNVRELENVLERAIALSARDVIQPADLQLTPPDKKCESETTDRQLTRSEGKGESEPAGGKLPLQDYLDRVERQAILEALDRTRFNKTAAAKVLGIAYPVLRRRMKRLGID